MADGKNIRVDITFNGDQYDLLLKTIDYMYCDILQNKINKTKTTQQVQDIYNEIDDLEDLKKYMIGNLL